MSGDNPNPDEALAADALARALEGDGSAEEIPEDALQAAALLRYSRDGGALPAARRRAILNELLDGAPVTTSRRRPVWRWLAPIVATTAALALAVVLTTRPDRSTPNQPAPLPDPSGELLSALGEAAQPRGELRPLSDQMRSYRRQLVASVSRHYGEAR